VKRALPSFLAFLGAVIVFAGQTGPDQALANLGSWLKAAGLGDATQWIWASGLTGSATAAGLVLLATAGLLFWKRRRSRPIHPARFAIPATPASAPLIPPSTNASGANPLLTQIDTVIDRLERATEAYASDPEGFFKLPKYSRLRVQVKELDDLTTAVKLAVRRKHGQGSAEDLHAASAIEDTGEWSYPPDDDYFRHYINWMVRLRGVAALLGQ
jgi:LPXTG-motif cell wall-anchored protein